MSKAPFTIYTRNNSDKILSARARFFPPCACAMYKVCWCLPFIYASVECNGVCNANFLIFSCKAQHHFIYVVDDFFWVFFLSELACLFASLGRACLHALLYTSYLKAPELRELAGETTASPQCANAECSSMTKSE